MLRLFFFLIVIVPCMLQPAYAKGGGYVLALSWSSAYCDAKYHVGRLDDAQCMSDRRYGFVVHGLWSQVKDGLPYAQYCSGAYSQHLPRQLVESVLPVMPSAGLVRYTWRKHGLCSGLAPEDYFQQLKMAHSRFSTPSAWLDLKEPMVRRKHQFKQDVMVANPKLQEGMFIVTCDKKNFREVRICLDDDLNYKHCSAQVLRNECSRESMNLLPVE